MSLAAVLFDVDGTLAATEDKGHRPAYNAAFAEFGLDWHWSPAFYRGLSPIAGGRERIAYYLDYYRPPLGGQAAAIARDRGAWLAALHRCKARHFRRALLRGRMPLRPGVARLIREAGQAGVAVALVTNASRATLAPFMAYALGQDLQKIVAAAVCGDDVARKKPAAEPYLTACERLGRRPDECIAIEDSQIGVEAASAAGIPCLVTLNADTRRHCFAKARAVLDTLGEPGVPVTRHRSPGFDFEIVDLAVLRRLHAETSTATSAQSWLNV